MTPCHYATTKTHADDTDEEIRAVVERETLDGSFIPVCDYHADLTSYYALSYRELGTSDEETRMSEHETNTADDCEHCAYMTSVGLPDHEVEISFLASDEATRFGLDWDSGMAYRDAVETKLAATDHAEVFGWIWTTRAWIRQTMLEFLNVDNLTDALAARGMTETEFEEMSR